jgi:hypothetical protein
LPSRDRNRDGDYRLERLLVAANRERPGEDFTGGVMTLVRRSARRRRVRIWVIGAALAPGVAAAIRMYPMPVFALLFVLGWPVVTRWVAR